MKSHQIMSNDRWMLIAIAMLTGATLSLWVAELMPYFISIPGIMVDTPIDLLFIATAGALTGLALFEAVDFIQLFLTKLLPSPEGQFIINLDLETSKKCLSIKE